MFREFRNCKIVLRSISLLEPIKHEILLSPKVYTVLIGYTNFAFVIYFKGCWLVLDELVRVLEIIVKYT